MAAVAEAFGNGLSVAIVLLAMWLLDPDRRIRLVRIITAVVLAGLGADLGKIIVSRTRPRSFHLYDTHVWETFGNWFPIGKIEAVGQSFPSAHTATAVALAVGLAWAYPRGRTLFAALAVLVAVQRIESCAHFLSDTLVGAAVGWIAVVHALHPRAVFGTIARLEQWLLRKRGSPRVANREEPTLRPHLPQASGARHAYRPTSAVRSRESVPDVT